MNQEEIKALEDEVKSYHAGRAKTQELIKSGEKFADQFNGTAQIRRRLTTIESFEKLLEYVRKLEWTLEFLRLNLPECDGNCAPEGSCITEKCLRCYCEGLKKVESKDV